MTPKDQVYWYTLKQPATQALTEDITVDVAVVGGGMAGLMCAQALREKGLSVAVVEAEYCGAGASGKSSGFITPDSELELSDLIANYGPRCAKELWEFVVSGCEAIRKNILDLHLDCDYQVQDSLFIANTEKGKQKVRHEYESRQQLAYQSTLYDGSQIKQVLGSKSYYGAVRYPGTFGIISYLYCQQLKDVLAKQGVEIYEKTPVTAINGHVLATVGGKVKAKNIIFCGDWFLPNLGIIPKDIYHAQTFLGLSYPLSADDQHKLFPADPLLVWDTDLIYQYFRLTGEGRLLLGGASMIYTYARWEKHLPPVIINKLRRYLRKKFPDIKIELEYLWPGLIGVSKDFLPLAGQHHELPDVYYIGGAAGLPWAAALGRYVAKKIINGGAADNFDGYFTAKRRYPLSYILQSVLGKPITFAISHAITKYLK